MRVSKMFKGLALVLMPAVLLALVGRAGECRTFSFGASGVVFTNAQANSVWSPSAALMTFADCPTGVVSFVRLSRGYSFLLSAAPTNNSSMVWIPEGSIYFSCGDALRFSSGGSPGVLQLMLRSGE